MPYFLSKQQQRLYFDLASVVQKVDNTIHQINLYPVDNANGFPNTYPLDIWRYPMFEQPGPGE